MSTLPPAVQAQSDYADQLMQGMQVAPENEIAEEQETQEDVQEQPQAQEQPQKDRDSEATWEQRYRSYQGHADAELAKMQRAVRESQDRQAQLEHQLNQALQALKEKETPPEPDYETLVTQADRDTYGEDFVDLQERVAKKTMATFRKAWDAERQALIRRMDELEQQLTGVSQNVGKTVAERFYERLAQLVPDWEQTNNDDGFLAWLRESDPLTGVQRQALLDDAGQRFDVDRVVAIFNAYKPPVQKTPDKSLQRQVSPSKSRAGNSAPVTSTDGKRIWTNSEIEQFYDRVVRGRISPEEAAKTENEINQAMAEGRIRP